MSKPLQVLIVEDSEDDAVLLVRQLRRGGYDPFFARVDTPASMKAALDGQSWDIVISDYSMPLFSAFAALNMLQERGLDLPFIIVSGAIGEETAVAAMKAGAHDYIMKDNVKRLIPAIDRELREAEVRRERSRAEAALRESEERYRSLVENLHMGVTLIDSNQTIIMTNVARSRAVGSTAVELVGRKCYEALQKRQTVCPDCHALRAMALRRPLEAEREDLGPNGKVCTVRVKAFPVLGPEGDVTGYIEVVEDITDRKRLENQLRQTAQLEAIGRLAGGIAHDFNNLLTAMMGYSNVLLQQLPPESLYREKVAQIGYAAEQAAGLTRQLLAFSRKQEMVCKVLDLNVVIGGLEKILRRLVGEDVELLASYDQSLARVKADSSQIGQIFTNLVVNARDAMPRGGALRIRTENAMLDEEFAQTHTDVEPGPYAMLVVEDTGMGMDAETCARIFDPFFTTKEEGKGTGLGLSTVYGIVKQHQGHIFVTSEPGKGTAFKVYFPGVDEPYTEILEVPVAPPRSLGDETVLVVEDEAIVRQVACEVLEMLGYRILDAAAPQEAVQVSRLYDGPIDLLLTDVVMPGMDGETLFRRLITLRPEMKVLYMSGYPEHSFVRRGVLHLGSNFLSKPFTMEGLATRVRNVLDGQGDVAKDNETSSA